MGKKTFVIGVDDGHGYDTAGKRSPSGYKENEFNHWTKVYLIEALKRCGFKIIDCSPSRKDNSLQNRCDIANNNDCDAFVSIHFNAMGYKWQIKAEGIETYYFPGSSKGEILAKVVHHELMQGTKMNNRGVKTARFYVLRYTKMPAILVECGFMDNKEDFALMQSTHYRKECSEEICKGFCENFGVKYIAPTSTSKTKSADEILDEVSNYASVWKDFIKENKHVNLEGLIQKLYYWEK